MLTLTCKRAAVLLSVSLERAPALRERLLLRLHLRLCAACARYKTQLLMLRQVLGQSAGRIEEGPRPDALTLTPDARARLKRNLRGADRSRTG